MGRNETRNPGHQLEGSIFPPLEERPCRPITVAVLSHFPFAVFSLHLTTTPDFAKMQEISGKSPCVHRKVVQKNKNAEHALKINRC